LPNDLNVYINCPYDEAYCPLLEALLFTITTSGYKARCALEDADGANARLDKIKTLIKESPRSIHDLSRLEVAADGNPRFMGLTMGARFFGTRRFKAHSALIMVRDARGLPGFLSNLGGNDPVAHGNDPLAIVRAVTSYLHRAPDGTLLRGPMLSFERFERFKDQLPDIARGIHRTPDEVHPIRDYSVYLAALDTFITWEQTAAQAAARE
jgi:hypothetical protein